jgi:hypothetical protein
LDIIGSHVDIYYLIQTYPKQQMSRILDAPNPPPHQGLMMIILGTDKTSEVRGATAFAKRWLA